MLDRLEGETRTHRKGRQMDPKDITKVGLAAALTASLAAKAVEVAKHPGDPKPIKEANNMLKGLASVSGSSAIAVVGSMKLDYDSKTKSYLWPNVVIDSDGLLYQWPPDKDV